VHESLGLRTERAVHRGVTVPEKGDAERRSEVDVDVAVGVADI
jgi:hypothetical protein